MDDSDRRLRRRRYLALAGAGLSALAGCSGSASPGDEEASTPTTNPTSTQTGPATNEPTATPGSDVAGLESAVAEVSFEGEYFDTHAHWLPSMGREIPARFAPMMERYDIGAAVLFSPSANAAQDYAAFLEQVTEPGVEYLPFMSAPPPGPRLDSSLRSLYESAGPAFWGIGEWKPQQEPAPPADGDRYTPLWGLAADLDIPVMFHPQNAQEGTVEPALAGHPETTFVLHGHQMLGYGKDGPGFGPTVPRLLEEYDNLYWQMDVGVMLSGRLLRYSRAAELVNWYESEGDGVVEIYRGILPELLAAAPERVLWGTDIARSWNLEADAFSILIDFTERVLEAVPTRHHAPYKRENARQLFGV